MPLDLYTFLMHETRRRSTGWWRLFAQQHARSELITARQPTLLHVTHWKAGSQWIFGILQALAPDRIVAPEIGEARLDGSLRPGHIYPTIYKSFAEVAALDTPSDTRHFVVIRDIRDTLVSLYFSWLSSHPILTEENRMWRARLRSVSRPVGLRMVMDAGLPYIGTIQSSWVASGQRIIRYEDLLTRDTEILEDCIYAHCDWSMSRQEFHSLVQAHRFEHVTGRSRGEEDVASHYRKGIVGDWKNHFDHDLKLAFKERFGELLVDSGYERNLDW